VADPRDPFSEVWGAVQKQLEESPGLEAKTLFEWLHDESARTRSRFRHEADQRSAGKPITIPD
jgi:hypothetical protein